jgi:hypothetical protein
MANSPGRNRRRKASREEAKVTLIAITSGTVDIYEGYRKLFAIYCSNNAALEEIKPMFQMPGIDPDGVFSVTPSFREQVRLLAEELLPLLSN